MGNHFKILLVGFYFITITQHGFTFDEKFYISAHCNIYSYNIWTLNFGQIDPASVMGPNKKGRKVTILGDTSDSSGIYEIAR